MASRYGNGGRSHRCHTCALALALLATVGLSLLLFSALSRRSQVLRVADDKAKAATAKATAAVSVLQKAADKLVAERQKEREEAKAKAVQAESEHKTVLKDAQDKLAEAESKKAEAEGKLKEAEGKKSEAEQMAQLHDKTAKAAKVAEGEAEKLRLQMVALENKPGGTASIKTKGGGKSTSPGSKSR